MEYKCDLCGETIKGDSLIYIDHMERHVIDAIKSEHPGWVEKNGVCPKCANYYKKELKGEGS